MIGTAGRKAVICLVQVQLCIFILAADLTLVCICWFRTRKSDEQPGPTLDVVGSQVPCAQVEGWKSRARPSLGNTHYNWVTSHKLGL